MIQSGVQIAVHPCFLLFDFAAAKLSRIRTVLSFFILFIVVLLFYYLFILQNLLG